MAEVLGSLRFRAAAPHVLLIVAAFAALGLYLLPKIEGDFRRSFEDDLASQARMVENLAQPLFASHAGQADFDRLAKELSANTATQITIIARDGTVLGDSEADPAAAENHLGRPEVQEALRSGRGSDERTSATGGEALTYVALRLGPADSPLGFARVARTSAAVDTSLSHITRSALIAVLITAIAAAAVSLLISETVLRPLGRLVSAVRSVASGRLDERIAPRPPGEMGELADAFNQMGEGLQELMAAASHERNRMVAALNSSSDAILAVNEDDRITFANTAAERLLMRRQDELVGNPLAWVMPQQAVITAVRATQEDRGRQSTLIDRPNQVLRVVTAPIIGGGEWTSLVVVQDLTDMRRVDQVRRDFIANVSHELRTPLASIKSVVETLRDGAMSDPAVAREFLSRADEEVDRLTQMVEELLELSRIESGQVALVREEVEVGEVLRRAADRLRGQADKKKQTLSVDIAPDFLPVVGDAERLERAVINLLHNAIKFTPAGGKIWLSAVASEEGVTVRVADTGAGISATDLPRIFERFYKADRSRTQGGGGTGLGLAVVRHTVEAHGGRIDASSSEGEGSLFTIVLPSRPVAAKR